MFERYIAGTKPSWKRRALIIVSLVLHGAIAVGLLVWSIIHIEEVSPPALSLTFFTSAPPPPPPPPPAARKPVERKVKPTRLQQPSEIPKLVQPVEPEKPEEPEDTAGVEGGVEGGVPGGVVGGIVNAPPPPPPPKQRIELDEGQVRLTKISGPDPEYTPQALEREVEGLMMVKCVVTADGLVRNCRVLKSLPFMDRAVIQALEQRRYKPYLANGQPVEIDYTFKVKLTLPQ